VVALMRGKDGGAIVVVKGDVSAKVRGALAQAWLGGNAHPLRFHQAWLSGHGWLARAWLGFRI
jgi:hypothetical protein